MWCMLEQNQSAHIREGERGEGRGESPTTSPNYTQWPPDRLHLLKAPSSHIATWWNKLLAHEPLGDTEHPNCGKVSRVLLLSLVTLKSIQSRLYLKYKIYIEIRRQQCLLQLCSLIPMRGHLISMTLADSFSRAPSSFSRSSLCSLPCCWLGD